jgi:hypothetical protein
MSKTAEDVRDALAKFVECLSAFLHLFASAKCIITDGGREAVGQIRSLGVERYTPARCRAPDLYGYATPASPYYAVSQM